MQRKKNPFTTSQRHQQKEEAYESIKIESVLPAPLNAGTTPTVQRDLTTGAHKNQRQMLSSEPMMVQSFEANNA